MKLYHTLFFLLGIWQISQSIKQLPRKHSAIASPNRSHKSKTKSDKEFVIKRNDIMNYKNQHKIVQDDAENEDDMDLYQEQGFAEGALRILSTASKSSFNIAKYSVKTALDALSIKFVKKSEVIGIWRVEQTLFVADGSQPNIQAVTIRLKRNGTVETRFKGKTYSALYAFVQRTWPRYCTINFEAQTLVDSRSEEPVSLYYKGYFKRSVLNRDVILMRGSVYQMQGRLL